MISIKHLSLGEKVRLAVSLFIIATLVIAIISSALTQSWFALFVSLAALILTFSPTVFERRYKIDLPVEFEIAVVIFVYASLFLGEVRGFYAQFWWWDLLLHGGSAIGFGLIGFIILYSLYSGGKVRAKPLPIVIFSFSFTVAIGVLWEIFEFTMDVSFGTNMQKSGLLDTMGDLIVNVVGSFFASVAGFVYMKTGKIHFFDRIMNKFEARRLR